MTSGSEKRVRSSHLTIRLTPEERAHIDAAAERAGLSSGSHARQVLLGAPMPRQVRRPPVERKELVRLLGAIGYVGNNINQIAHALNAGGEIDEPAILEALSSLKPVRDAILVALGREP